VTDGLLQHKSLVLHDCAFVWKINAAQYDLWLTVIHKSCLKHKFLLWLTDYFNINHYTSWLCYCLKNKRSAIWFVTHCESQIILRYAYMTHSELQINLRYAYDSRWVTIYLALRIYDSLWVTNHLVLHIYDSKQIALRIHDSL
jgi:hypothetical protein